MQRVLFIILLVSSLNSHAQQGTKEGQDRKKLAFDDSSIQKLQRLKDSVAAVNYTRDSIQLQENISRNADGLFQLQKEQNAKKKKAAMIRIGIGIALLAVLIIGLRRRKK